MNGQPILAVTGLGKRFGGFVALENIDLTVSTGERLGLIAGSNHDLVNDFLNVEPTVRRRSERRTLIAAGTDKLLVESLSVLNWIAFQNFLISVD